MSKCCQKIKGARQETHAFFRNVLSVIKLHYISELDLVCS